MVFTFTSMCVYGSVIHAFVRQTNLTEAFQEKKKFLKIQTVQMPLVLWALPQTKAEADMSLLPAAPSVCSYLQVCGCFQSQFCFTY